MKNKTLFYILLGISWVIALITVFGTIQTTSMTSDLQREKMEAKKLYLQTEVSLQATQAKLKAKDKKELLAVLKHLPPTIGVTNAQGKRLRINQSIPLVAEIRVEAFLPDTIQKILPNELKYEITDMEIFIKQGNNTYSRRIVKNKIKLADLSEQPIELMMISVKKMYLIHENGMRTLVEPTNNNFSIHFFRV